MASEDERQTAQHEMVLRAMANRLEGEFGDMFTRETLHHYVRDSYAQMASTSRILNHIPAFVERFARQRLRALAKTRGVVEDHPPIVLFVCERNDAASQMAAGLCASRAGDRAVVHSAGTAPAPELLSEAVVAMSEIGVDLSGEMPKPVTPEIEEAADVVVTLDPHDDVPIVADTRYVAWRTADEHEAGLDGYRRLRDTLDERVRALLEEILPPSRVLHRTFDDELAQLQDRVLAMGRAAAGLLRDANAALGALDRARSDAVVAGDDAVDSMYREIEQAVVELIARRQPVAGDLRLLVALLQTGTHLERIGDSAVDVAEIVRRPVAGRPEPAVIEQLQVMGERVIAMVEAAMAALDGRDRTLTLGVATADDSVDSAQDTVLEMLLEASGNGTTREWCLLLDRISRIYERAGDHAVDIAEAVWFQITGEFRQFRSP